MSDCYVRVTDREKEVEIMLTNKQVVSGVRNKLIDGEVDVMPDEMGRGEFYIHLAVYMAAAAVVGAFLAFT